MRTGSNEAATVRHLIEQARDQYGATRFTVLARPRAGRIGIRFQVPPGTPARRPEPPPDEVKPTQWSEVTAEVISDMEDNLHMSWRWPVEEDSGDQILAELAREHNDMPGVIIEVR